MKIHAGLLLFVILAVSSLIAVEAAQASVSKPTVPEFTLKYIDTSYDVPSSTTTTTDPYTGKQTVTTHPGYHVKDGYVEVIIKNQQFTQYSIDNHQIFLFYNFSSKGHYAEGWTYYPGDSYGREYSPIYITQTTSDYTAHNFSAPPEGKIDFRVQAQIGYYNTKELYIMVPGAPFTELTFVGEVSGWSNTQTITIGQSDSTTAPNTSPPQDSTTTPNQPVDQPQNPAQSSTERTGSQNAAPFILDWEQLAIVTLLAVVVLMSVVILFLRRRITKKT